MDLKERDILKQDYNIIWKKLLAKNEFRDDLDSRRINLMAKKYISLFNYPRVLEIGCGTGIDINIVYESNNNIFPYATDILTASIKLGCNVSKSFDNKIEFFVSDTLNLPIKNRNIDIIFSQGLIEHFKNPLEVIKEQERVLKKGGYLIISVPQKFTGYTLMKKKKIKQKEWKLGWEKEFSYISLKKLGENLKLMEVDVAGYQYWKSWKEPVFVMKDLVDKVFRRLPLNNIRLFKKTKLKYNAIWEKLEKKWGHYFLQNIVIVFQK